jgi:transcriptional regulator with GAF, ATPase, and Fis domain
MLATIHAWGDEMSATATVSHSACRNRLLIASANPAFREKFRKHRDYVYFTSEEAFGGAHALASLYQSPCQSVLLDRNLPDLDASEVAQLIRDRFPATHVEIVDSEGDEERAFNERHCLVSENKSPSETEEDGSDDRVSALPRDTAGGNQLQPLPGIIGRSLEMQHVYQMVRLVAKRDTPVLITGETGTGKELVADAVHQLSPRARQQLVVVNCAAIPESLLESELFGHNRGAFTGALQSRAGRVQSAHGGTLFLDEIGELPLTMQAKLLRFLQSGEVQRLGSTDAEKVNARVIAATNAPLMDLIQKKEFRPDLYYRLAVFPIDLPPLSARADDIPDLAEYFLSRLSVGAVGAEKKLSKSAITYLRDSPWPGNVRELQHAVERAFILSGNETELSHCHFQTTRKLISIRGI